MARRWTPVVFALALVAGCSSNPAEEFVGRYLRARCEVEARCSGRADFLVDGCVAQGIGPSGVADALKAVLAGRAAYDPGRASGCLSALANLEWCDDTLAADRACAAALHGTAPSSALCSSDWDCQSGGCSSCADSAYCLAAAHVLYWFTSDTSPPFSQCAGHLSAVAGLSCFNPAVAYAAPNGACSLLAICASGQRCTNGACVPSQEGDPCPGRGGLTDVPPLCGLASGLYCLRPAAASGPGTCQKRIPRGAACAVGGGGWIPYSESNPCEVGSVCVGGGLDLAGNALTGACAPVSDEGGPCVPQQGGEVVTGCKLGLACEEGRCAIPPSSGPCADASMEGFWGQNSCGPGSFCDVSKDPPACTPMLPDGAACTCPEGSCEGGICLGANCIDPMTPADTHGTCASGVCHER